MDYLFFLFNHMTTRLNIQHDSLQFSSSPPSPSPSLDYSIVSPPSPSPDRDAMFYASQPARSQPYLSSSRGSGSSSRDRDKRTNAVHGSSLSYHRAAGGNRAPHTGKSMKFILPRLWGALSSPTRKARRQSTRRKPYALPSNISYADLQPLDGEEGELIDDEGCYVERYDSAQSPRKLIGPRFHPLSSPNFLKPCCRFPVLPPARDRPLSPLLPRSFLRDRLSECLAYMEHSRQRQRRLARTLFPPAGLGYQSRPCHCSGLDTTDIGRVREPNQLHTHPRQFMVSYPKK